VLLSAHQNTLTRLADHTDMLAVAAAPVMLVLKVALPARIMDALKVRLVASSTTSPTDRPSASADAFQAGSGTLVVRLTLDSSRLPVLETTTLYVTVSPVCVCGGGGGEGG
jgi:hypothetical protein